MSNTEQIEYWNGEAGQRWADSDSMMERILRPITQALLAHAPVQGCKRAVDVGCGGGSQSIQLARALGPEASVLGIDISQPMLEVARARADKVDATRAEVSFLQTDASSHAFEPGAFDLLFSRFGVMFFDDPVAAFSNLRNAMVDEGRLMFCCWQPLKDNEWTWIPIQTALQHLPAPEPTDPYAPGPFAFADPDRVESILTESGFSKVEAAPCPVTLQFGQGPALRDCVLDLVKIGPVGRLLDGVDSKTFDTVCAALESAMEPYYRENTLHLPGAVWFVSAITAQPH